jgi:hypothetical protein
LGVDNLRARHHASSTAEAITNSEFGSGTVGEAAIKAMSFPPAELKVSASAKYVIRNKWPPEERSAPWGALVNWPSMGLLP